MSHTDEMLFITDAPAKRRCSQGHEFEAYTIPTIAVGTQEFCLTCIEEKVPALLEWIGIGRMLPPEGENQ